MVLFVLNGLLEVEEGSCRELCVTILTLVVVLAVVTQTILASDECRCASKCEVGIRLYEIHMSILFPPPHHRALSGCLRACLHCLGLLDSYGEINLDILVLNPMKAAHMRCRALRSAATSNRMRSLRVDDFIVCVIYIIQKSI